MLVQSPGRKAEELSRPWWFRREMPGEWIHWSSQAEGKRAGMDWLMLVVAAFWGFRCVPTVEEAERGV